MRWLILVAAGVLGLSACRAEEEGDRALGAEPPTPIEQSDRSGMPTNEMGEMRQMREMRDGIPSAGPATDVTSSPPVSTSAATDPRTDVSRSWAPTIKPRGRSEGMTRGQLTDTPPESYRGPSQDIPPGMPGGTQREMQPSEPRPSPEVPPGTRPEMQPSSPPPIFPPEGIAPGRDNGPIR